MKLKAINKVIFGSMPMIGLIFALTSSLGHAGTKGHVTVEEVTPGKFYVGIFGGFASSNKFNINQYGTAFYTEALGGPLAVNAFGTSNSKTAGFIGGQVGYVMPDVSIYPCFSWHLAPAAELEGYYIGRTTFTTDDVNNNTARLLEHDFVVSYPTSIGVFLANAVLNFNIPCQQFHPYLGVGIGAAIVSISNATATQIAPPEPGINHFNSNPSDKASTFAGQVKVGLSYDICRNTSVFAEYRWLYLASTSYAFGSTVYPGHPETSNWQVKIDPRQYNMGAIGIQYSLS